MYWTWWCNRKSCLNDRLKHPRTGPLANMRRAECGWYALAGHTFPDQHVPLSFYHIHVQCAAGDLLYVNPRVVRPATVATPWVVQTEPVVPVSRPGPHRSGIAHSQFRSDIDIEVDQQVGLRRIGDELQTAHLSTAT